MNNRERLKEIIIQLKQIKNERELSLTDIHKMVEQSGGYTSQSTIRRVFAEGSEDSNFRYRDTIQPIAQALIGVHEDSEPLDAAQADALKNIALLKDSMIQELQQENATLAERVADLEINYNNELAKSAFLLDQVKKKDTQIENLHRLITKVLGDE